MLAAQSNNPAGSARAVKQLQAWTERADWPSILDGFARCVRITRDQAERYSVNSKQLSEPAERELDRVSQSVASVQSVDQLLNTVLPMIGSSFLE